MSDTSPAIIGVESCGCVTYATTRVNDLDRETQAALGRIVAGGGQVLRTTAGNARRRKHFLPAKCPHKPKGWVAA